MHIHTIQLNIDKLNGGTAFMDAAEFGAYMSLIIQCYRCKNSLPDNDSKLSRLARCTPKIWQRVRPEIAPKFQIKDGFWSHPVVQTEIDKYQSQSTKNKANVLKRYNTILPTVEPEEQSGNTNINNKNIILNNNTELGLFPDKPIPKSISNGYTFEGKVIKLTAKDFDSWLTTYGGTYDQFFDFLDKRDDWYAKQPPEVKKKWFVTTGKYINSMTEAAE